MRVILNIDDKLFTEMQTAADIKEKSLDQLICEILVKYVLSPYDYAISTNLDEIEDFRFKLAEQIHLLLPYINNDQMVEVFKHLRDEISDDSFVLTELHKRYNNN